MLSWQGLLLMFMFGYGMAILVEGLIQMYRESKALRNSKK